MNRYNTCKDAADCPRVEYPGTSETIPGLAPDLKSLLAAAMAGEPLTPVGEPVYDFEADGGNIRPEDFENAKARLEVDQLSPADLQETAERSEAARSEDAAATGKPDAAEEERSDDDKKEGSDGAAA